MVVVWLRKCLGNAERGQVGFAISLLISLVNHAMQLVVPEDNSGIERTWYDAALAP
jgi:hypothetical protein